MRVPNQILNAASISHLLGDDFEEFCGILIDYERHYRHDGAGLEGPTRPSVGDQGSDLLLTVSRPPRLSQTEFEGALTEDGVGRTVSLCKTGSGYASGLVEDCGKRIPLQVASDGGLIIAIVNIQLSTPEREALAHRLISELAESLSVDGDLIADRVKVKDANDLQRFYSYHPLNLRPEMRIVLGIPNLEGLLFFEEWLQYLSTERFWPEFAPDSARNDAIGAMAQVFGRITAGGNPSCIWLYGPPGVGKSRLVAEAVADNPSFGQRVLVARDFESGLRAISQLDIPKYGDAILIVDECPKSQIHTLLALFAARSQGGSATLVLIGPQDGQDVPSAFREAGGLPIQLTPLASEATQQLIERELGVAASDTTLVQRILNLTEGYPGLRFFLAGRLRTTQTYCPKDQTSGSLQVSLSPAPEQTMPVL